jgi:hypothetical protein
MPMTIFKADHEVAAPGRTLQCTELLAEFINECEWKRDVTGVVEKKWFATSNLILTSLLMEEGRLSLLPLGAVQKKVVPLFAGSRYPQQYPASLSFCPWQRPTSTM